MGLGKWLGIEDDNSEARINSLIGSNHKLTDMVSMLMTSHQETLNRVVEQYNRLNTEVENIKKYLKEREQNE
ncbi:hypothetical protein ES702_07281 [subsurface metagenome]